MTVHATTVALAGEAILIRGDPGSGKSSLALELMETPGTGLGSLALKASLIADDQTELTAGNGRIWCSVPHALAGLLEVRGLGLITVPVSGPAPLKLVIDLVAPGSAPRLPGASDLTTSFLGISAARVVLERSSPALAARVRTAFLRL